jgi:hypothetical protein
MVTLSFAELRAPLRAMAPTSMPALLLVVFVGCLGRASGLRTGIAPSYIPTMRQKSSYETSSVNDLTRSVTHLMVREAAQVEAFNRMEASQSGKDVEQVIRTKKTTAAATLRATLNTLEASRRSEEDGSTEKVVLNKRLEVQSVHEQDKIFARAAYLLARDRHNSHLESHAAKVLAHNQVLDQEKDALRLSLDAERLGERRQHQEAVKSEAQRAKEFALRDHYTAARYALDSYKSDLITRNAKQSSLVPGLTTARDNHEATKLDDEIRRNDFQLQTDGYELSTSQLESSNAALQDLITRYQQANTDMNNLILKLSSEQATLTSERDGKQSSWVAAITARNAAQLKADHWQDHLEEMINNRERTNLQSVNDAQERDNESTMHDKFCTDLLALKATLATKQAANKAIRDHCF